LADDYYKKALSLIRPKTLTVWEIMIPVIFILNYAKLKQSREIFIQNQMFTKKMALDAAMDMKKKDRSKETVMAQIRSKTKELVSSVPGGIYSDDIRRQQLNEMDLLIDHFSKLLNAEGRDYASLVTSAYRSATEYHSFLNQLKSAENEVMGAARRTLGDKTDMATAAKIESITANMRTAEVKKIFSSDSQPQDAE
jgi:uncharacterized protein YcbK (DUF882 family)